MPRTEWLVRLLVAFGLVAYGMLACAALLGVFAGFWKIARWALGFAW